MTQKENEQFTASARGKSETHLQIQSGGRARERLREVENRLLELADNFPGLRDSDHDAMVRWWRKQQRETV